MARLKCAECEAVVSRSDVVCRRCGSSLLDDGSVVEVPASADTLTSANPAEPGPAAPGPGSDQPDPAQSAGPVSRCPHCGADVPDPRNLVCIECMRELKPAATAAESPPSPGARDPYATTYEPKGARLQLSFGFGVVELEVGQEVMLGRDAPDQRLAALHEMRNISRQHATIGLSADGAWVRDERSTNGTYVNNSQVAAGETVGLGAGAELRLASNVRAGVRIYQPGEADHG